MSGVGKTGQGRRTGVRGKKEICDETTPEQIAVKRAPHLREQRGDADGLVQGQLPLSCLTLHTLSLSTGNDLNNMALFEDA